MGTIEAERLSSPHEHLRFLGALDAVSKWLELMWSLDFLLE